MARRSRDLPRRLGACLPTLTLVACTSAGGAAAETATYLWQDDPLAFGWNERLGAAGDPDVLVGFSRHAREVKPGIWGWNDLTATGASTGEAASVPGLGPVYEGGQVALDTRVDCAFGYVFAGARTSVRLALGDGYRDTPNGDPRAIWTGTEPTADIGRLEAVVRMTVGAAALRHVLAVSNEPFHWGPGIFGGVVMGMADRGFPHAVLTTGRPWVLADINGEPLLLRTTESVVGVLDDSRSGPEDPLLVAHRVGLRWSWLEFGWNVARQTGGKHQRPPSGRDSTWYPVWSTSDFDDESRADTLASVDLSFDIAQRVRLGGEYGVDNLLAPSDAHGFFGRYATNTAAWIVNVDAYDLTGEGTMRLAAEWYRSEAYFYGPSTTYAGWSYGDAPIAHADGGNAQSLRLLFQQRLDYEDGELTLILGWRELGRRNAERDNPETTYGTAPNAFAPRAWTTLSADLRYSWDAGFARAEIFGGVRDNENRAFTTESGLDGEGGVGLRREF